MLGTVVQKCATQFSLADFICCSEGRIHSIQALAVDTRLRYIKF